jgi:hypothetical protein
LGKIDRSFSNGATRAPTEPETESTLPIVKSTSLTTIPGDAKFNGIFFYLVDPKYLKIFIVLMFLSGE